MMDPGAVAARVLIADDPSGRFSADNDQPTIHRTDGKHAIRPHRFLESAKNIGMGLMMDAPRLQKRRKVGCRCAGQCQGRA